MVQRKVLHLKEAATSEAVDPGRVTLPAKASDNEIIATGMDAWEWCKANPDRTWKQWKRVGAALLVGRRGAQREAGTDDIQSHAYRSKFGPWLKKHGFDDDNMDKTVRADLLNIMENLESVEKYLADLAKLEPLKRAKWTHPANIWDAWSCEILRCPGLAARANVACPRAARRAHRRRNPPLIPTTQPKRSGSGLGTTPSSCTEPT